MDENRMQVIVYNKDTRQWSIAAISAEDFPAIQEKVWRENLDPQIRIAALEAEVMDLKKVVKDLMEIWANV